MNGSSRINSRRAVDAEDLIKAVKDPALWVQKSISLRRAANKLWEAFFRTSLLGTFETPKPESEQQLDEALEYLLTAKMLYGLAIETALKGHLVAADPKNTNIEVQIDGAGTVVQAELKQVGVSFRQGHDLKILAEKAGAFTKLANRVDAVQLADVLKHLTDCVTWLSKYPAPKKSGGAFVPNAKTPLLAFQHYVRDLIDPLLDAYQPGVDHDAASLKELDQMYKIAEEERVRRMKK